MTMILGLWQALLNTPDGIEFAIVALGSLVFLGIVAYDKLVR